jgi:hypothetical protein
MKKKVCRLMCNNWLIVGVVIILLGFDFYCHIPTIDISNIGLVLSFIGVLATFVVISNYAQVHKIERKVENFDKEIRKLKKEIELLKNDIQAGKYDTITKNVIEQMETGIPSILNTMKNQ